MNRMLGLLIIAALTAFSLNIGAQDDKRLGLAMELVAALHLESEYQSMINKTIDTMLSNDPSIKLYEDIVRSFIAKYMPWEAMKSEIAKMYAHDFNEEELRQLLEFYHSPVAQKMLTLNGQSMKTGRDLVFRALTAHKDEFEAAVNERAKEIEALKQKAK